MLQSLAFVQLQKALYSALTADGGITGAVYDEVPENSSFPYTCFSEMRAVPFEARGVNGMAILVILETYSRKAGGNAECQGIQKEIIETVMAASLAMTNFWEVMKRVEQVSIEKKKEEPGLSYLGITSFTITVQKK